MSDSYVITDDGEHGAIVFAGPDAVDLYRAILIKHGLRLLQAGIKPTRGVSMTKALILVGRYTGKTYKRTQSEQAIADLDVWIGNMRSALPIHTGTHTRP